MVAKPDHLGVEAGCDLFLAVGFVNRRMCEAVADLESIAHRDKTLDAKSISVVIIDEPRDIDRTSAYARAAATLRR